MTAWANNLNGQGFREWLLELVPPGKAIRLSPGQTLDPFGSSMRTLSTQAKVWMTAFRKGEELEGERRESQALSDLRSAGLIEAGSNSLTLLGDTVLDRWEQVALSDGFENELPLAVALLLEALGRGIEQYCDRLAFWWDIRSLYDVDKLLGDEETLLLLPYLNQTRAGFNPWAALLGARLPVGGPIDWQGLKEGVAGADDGTDAALDELAKKTADKRPFAARVVFCRAMEYVFMSRFEAGRITAALAELALPVRS